MYNRVYQTTADDRRERYLRQDDAQNPEIIVVENADGGQSPLLLPHSSPSVLLPPNPDMLFLNQLGEQNVPAAHSTRVANPDLGNNLPNDNGSEMSFQDDGGRRAQVVTFNNASNAVHMTPNETDRRANLEFWSLGVNSSGGGTEYRDMPTHQDQTGIRHSQTNPFLPGYGGVVQSNQVGMGEQIFRAAENNVVPTTNYRHFLGAINRENVAPMTNYGHILGSHRESNTVLNPSCNQWQVVPANNPGLLGLNDLTKTDRAVLMELIKNVNATDGSDELQLLQFLKDLKPLFDISPATSDQVIKLLIPKTRGQLFKLWVEGTTSRVSWENLHGAILNHFLPVGRRRELETQELDRPQRPGESFVEFVDNIVAVAFALRTTRSEEEVIESVLCKCSPATKVHFAFNERPRNIFELKVFANKVTGSMKTETRYFGSMGSATDRNVRMATGASYARQNPQNYQRPKGNLNDRSVQRERVIKCYKCNGEGHIARNCPSVN